MEKRGLFFHFVWTGATRLTSRTAPLCSPLLTDSPSQEARGLYACPHKILSPQGRVILAGPWGGGGLLSETKHTFHSSRWRRRLHIMFEIAPPGWSRGLKTEKPQLGVGGGGVALGALLFIVFILTGSRSCCFTLVLIERNQQSFFFFSSTSFHCRP